jgi:hypothetical protein
MKSKPLNTRLFKILCEEKYGEHTALLLHTHETALGEKRACQCFQVSIRNVFFLSVAPILSHNAA